MKAEPFHTAPEEGERDSPEPRSGCRRSLQLPPAAVGWPQVAPWKSARSPPCRRKQRRPVRGHRHAVSRPQQLRAPAATRLPLLTIKFPATGGWKTPLKEHREKGQEEKLKSPETRSRQRWGSLLPDRLTRALLLKVWGRWATVHGDWYTSPSSTWVEKPLGQQGWKLWVWGNHQHDRAAPPPLQRTSLTNLPQVSLWQPHFVLRGNPWFPTACLTDPNAPDQAPSDRCPWPSFSRPSPATGPLLTL